MINAFNVLYYLKIDVSKLRQRLPVTGKMNPIDKRGLGRGITTHDKKAEKEKATDPTLSIVIVSSN